jgi:hypothetical protein
MSDFNLARILMNPPSNGMIEIPPGEFQGSWIISRPVQLIGSGLSTVLWKEKGPVLKIQSSGVKLAGLSLEVSEEIETTTLEVDSRVQPMPQFQQVRVLGKISGLPDWDSWNFPRVIDLGKIRGRSPLVRTIGLPITSAISIRSTMAGLTAEVTQSSLGQRALRLVVDSEILNPGALLDGLIEVEMAGIFTVVRITGEVFTTIPTVASSRAGDAEITAGADIFSSVKPKSQKSGPVAKSAPAPPPQRISSKAEANKDLDTAEAFLIQAGQLEPHDLKIHQLLADFYERHNNLACATTHWEFLHRSDVENIEVILHLAKCYLQTSHTNNVIELLEETLKRPEAKKVVEIYKTLAMAYKRNNSNDEAIWALQQALSIKVDKKLAQLLKVWQSQ